MKIEKMRVDFIKSNDKNPRLITDDKLRKLVKSIREFPEMLEIRPIVIDENNVVIGGNQRWKASQMAGLTEVPVIKVEHLTEEQKKQFIIKDNVNHGDWDWEVLISDFNLDNLRDWGQDVPNFGMNEEPEIDMNIMGEKLDRYINAQIKRITLFYTMEPYKQMMVDLDRIAEERGLEDNSEVVDFLVDFYLNKRWN
jgi:hypothetical protein